MRTAQIIDLAQAREARARRLQPDLFALWLSVWLWWL